MNDNEKEKFDILMTMHFQRFINKAYETGKFISGDDLSCDVCEDFINGHCAGEGRKGCEVADCILDKLQRSEVIMGSKN